MIANQEKRNKERIYATETPKYFGLKMTLWKWSSLTAMCYFKYYKRNTTSKPTATLTFHCLWIFSRIHQLNYYYFLFKYRTLHFLLLNFMRFLFFEPAKSLCMEVPSSSCSPRLVLPTDMLRVCSVWRLHQHWYPRWGNVSQLLQHTWMHCVKSHGTWKASSSK